MESPHDTDPLAAAPLLQSIPKGIHFVVPDGFFERFPHQVQNAIARREAKRSSLASWLGLSPSALRLTWAAGAVLALVLAAFWLRPWHDAPAPIAMDGEAAAMLPSMEDLDWSEADLYALLEEEPAAWPASAGAGFTAEELEAYLLSTEPPFDLLTEEL